MRIDSYINDPEGRYKTLETILMLAHSLDASSYTVSALKNYCKDMKIDLTDPPVDFTMAVKDTRLESILVDLIALAREEAVRNANGGLVGKILHDASRVSEVVPLPEPAGLLAI